MSSSTPLSSSQQAETTPPISAETTNLAALQRRRRIRRVGGVVLLIALALVVWRVFFATPALPDSIVASVHRWIERDKQRWAPFVAALKDAMEARS